MDCEKCQYDRLHFLEHPSMFQEAQMRYLVTRRVTLSRWVDAPNAMEAAKEFWEAGEINADTQYPDGNFVRVLRSGAIRPSLIEVED